MADIDYTKYGLKPENDASTASISGQPIDYSKYGGKGETIDLGIPFFHDFPKNVPSLTPGTPQYKQFITHMISSGGGILPGVSVAGAAPEIVSSLASKGFQNLKNLAQAAFGGIPRAEEELQSAIKSHELATKEAEPTKPGLYQSPSTQLETMEDQIGTLVNAEANHGQRISSTLKSRGKAIEDFWGDAFGNFEQKIKDAKFQVPQSAMNNFKYGEDFENAVEKKVDAGMDYSDAYKELEKERSSLQANPYYNDLLDTAPTPRDIDASTFLAKYRDFRDTLGGLRQDLRSDKYGSLEKKQIQKAIDAGQEKFNQIKDVLDKGLGDFKPEFDWLNEGYRNQVFPLRQNLVMQAAKNGKVSSDMISSLQTNQPGMSLVRDIVKQDPELLRNVIGQRYIKNPSSIHFPNEDVRDFLDHMPDLKNLLQQKQNLLQQTATSRDVALAEKVKAQNKLDQLKQGKSNIKKGLLTGAVAAGASYPLAKLGSYLFGNNSGEE